MIKTLFVTSELAPWVKTGGLADVAQALPPALRAEGVDVRVLVPMYPALAAAFPDAPVACVLEGLGGVLPGAVLRRACTADGVPLLLLDCAACYARPGNPYLGADGRDWHDNAIRFGLLSHVAAVLGSPANPLDWQAQIVHCNDWQAALAPALLHYLYGSRVKTLLTVHNLAFQGLFGPHVLAELGLPPHAWAMDGVEYYGHFSFLKAGLQRADLITTVSPSYAREIQQDSEGMGLAGLLRYRREDLVGILNGIDTQRWDPARDPLIGSGYTAQTLARKSANKRALQRQLGLAAREDWPLFGVVSRLVHQKGLDLLLPLVDALQKLPAQLVVLGSGDRALEEALASAAQRHPANIAVRIGFDEKLAHLIEAGCDAFVMPSRFEPCGLNQMYSLRYGTPPIVRKTGGLADTVIDAADKARGNGFVFDEASAPALFAAIERAAALWQRPRLWRALQQRAMAAQHDWQGPAQAYRRCYAGLLQQGE